jgi:hypothetical protein
LVDSDVLNVTGSTFTTYTENWQNVDTVMISSTGSLPVNWGSGTLYMDNVTLNNPLPTPEPSSLVVCSGVGALGITIGWLRRRRQSA